MFPKGRTSFEGDNYDEKQNFYTQCISDPGNANVNSGNDAVVFCKGATAVLNN